MLWKGKEKRMNLQYYYYFFKHALTPVFCDHILQYAKDKQEKEHEAKVGPGNPQVNLETRKTKVNWISDRWVYKELRPLVFEANKKNQYEYKIVLIGGGYLLENDVIQVNTDDPEFSGTFRVIGKSISFSPTDYSIAVMINRKPPTLAQYISSRDD